MNAKQKLHQAKLSAWKARFQEQDDSGLTVKDWCEQNNLSIHTYNYWKHLLEYSVPPEHRYIFTRINMMQGFAVEPVIKEVRPLKSA